MNGRIVRLLARPPPRPLPPIPRERRNSRIEAQLELQMRALKLPGWVRNLVFLEHRKFELDFAWPSLKFAVEVDGHVHRIKERFNADHEKHALAMLAGWTVLRVGGQDIRNGSAVTWVETMLSRSAVKKTEVNHHGR